MKCWKLYFLVYFKYVIIWVYDSFNIVICCPMIYNILLDFAWYQVLIVNQTN